MHLHIVLCSFYPLYMSTSSISHIPMHSPAAICWSTTYHRCHPSHHHRDCCGDSWAAGGCCPRAPTTAATTPLPWPAASPTCISRFVYMSLLHNYWHCLSVYEQLDIPLKIDTVVPRVSAHPPIFDGPMVRTCMYVPYAYKWFIFISAHPHF